MTGKGLNQNYNSDLEFIKVDKSFNIEALLDEMRTVQSETGAHNLRTFTRNFWEWHYQDLPGGDARIYLCMWENQIRGYYHVPIYAGVVNGVKKKFGMVQDVAISPTMRGRGAFRRLAEFATEDLLKSDVDVIYMFPNHKSIHTFLKYTGYRSVGCLDAYIMPVKTATILRSQSSLLGLEQVVGFVVDRLMGLFGTKLDSAFELRLQRTTSAPFTGEVINLYEQFGHKFGVRLLRTREYLNWRFINKPVDGGHFILSLFKENTIVASGIFKVDEMLGVKTAVLLDFAFKREDDLFQLLKRVQLQAEQLFGEHIAMIFTAAFPSVFHKREFGFFKVPHRLNPRPLHLLVKGAGSEIFDSTNWLVTLTDWDVL